VLDGCAGGHGLEDKHTTGQHGSTGGGRRPAGGCVLDSGGGGSPLMFPHRAVHGKEGGDAPTDGHVGCGGGATTRMG
jgi:hypothetical protein